VLFSNVNLKFLKGAKIGMLGCNGSGKSSLMKVIAGLDTDFDGKGMFFFLLFFLHMIVIKCSRCLCADKKKLSRNVEHSNQ